MGKGHDALPQKHYCPFQGCIYSENRLNENGRFFSKKLTLNQHILNKHTEKKYSCSHCGKKYAAAFQLDYHSKVCGRIWTCYTCKREYDKRNSLRAHCSKLGHVSVPANAGGSQGDRIMEFTSRLSGIVKSPQINIFPQAPPVIYFVPKPVIQTVLVSGHSNPNTSDCSVQATSATEDLSRSTIASQTELSVIGPICRKRRSNQTTQTVYGSKRNKSNASSQFPPLFSKRSQRSTTSHSTMETQTTQSTLHSGAPKDHDYCIRPPPLSSHASNISQTTSTSSCSTGTDPDLYTLDKSLSTDRNPVLTQASRCNAQRLTTKGTNTSFTEWDMDVMLSSRPEHRSNQHTQTHHVAPYESSINVGTQFDSFDRAWNEVNNLEDLCALLSQSGSGFNELNTIETQTQWNYDEGTQTESEGWLTPWKHS